MESVEEAAGDAAIGVDAAVAKERPVLAGDFGEFGVDFSHEDGFRIVGGFGENATERVGDEGASPELEAGCLVGLVEDAVDADGPLLMADAVDGSDVNTVGDGVGTLHGAPGVVLGGSVFFFL